MTPDEEAALRKQILELQRLAARQIRKGIDTSRPDDPSYHFAKAKEYVNDAEALQRELEAAGRPREPERDQHHFRWS